MPETIRRLVLADGTTLDQSECGYADHLLWCYIKNLTFAEAFQIFSDPDKIKSITFEYGLETKLEQVTYESFTVISSIIRRETTIDICLEKEVAV